ncbi:hypothetical protein C8R43DRAFT_1009757 [Mycena crocata]|nr:hypothetical protein C8R43DRAFT_1009757 [Mycena crocata]
MSSSAIPHVIAFLTRPLLSASAPASVTSAQLILNASLAPNGTFTLTSSTSQIPPPLHAASIGAGIPWTAWFNALGGGRDVLLFYGPGYLKVRVGDAQVTDVWSEETPGSVVPISRLRGALLSARVRSLKRAEQQQQAEPIRAPSLVSDSESSEDSFSDSDSDSDYASSTSSRFTSCSSSDSLTSAASSPPPTPAKTASLMLPPVPTYVVLPRRSQAAYRAPRTSSVRPVAVDRAVRPVPVDLSKKDTTAYIYQGGVTRVMTGGVLLGPRPRS